MATPVPSAWYTSRSAVYARRTDPFEPNEPILVCEPGPETRNLGRGRMGFRGVAGPSRDADHTCRLRSVGLSWRAHESARRLPPNGMRLSCGADPRWRPAE